jgi:hypothetical protein
MRCIRVRRKERLSFKIDVVNITWKLNRVLVSWMNGGHLRPLLVNPFVLGANFSAFDDSFMNKDVGIREFWFCCEVGGPIQIQYPTSHTLHLTGFRVLIASP